eukprot:3743360-Pyramimonas_sp.AAC.1
MARLEADSAGFDIPNFQIVALILFCAVGVGTFRAAQLLQPLNHQMPRCATTVRPILERMRSHGHLAERSQGSIWNIFSGRSAGTYRAEISDAPAAMPNSIWND